MAEYEVQNPRAREIVERMFARQGPRRLAQLERLDPELRRVMEDVIYGGFYTRDVLDQKTRELCAVAALTVLGRTPQLRTHMIAALGAGATRAEVQEVVIQMAVYAGFPAMLGGLDLMEHVWADLDAATASP